jgi:hypothetical protein
VAKAPKAPFSHRLAISRTILSQSLKLLKREKHLLILPILSALILTAFFIAFTIFAIKTGAFDFDPNEERGFWSPILRPLIILPLALPIGILVSILNGALAYGLHEALEGRHATVKASLRRAFSRWRSFTGFSIISLIVAGILQLLGALLAKLQIIPYLGRLTQSLGMLAFAAATFFVVPILVVQRDPTTTSAIKESATIAKAQWGKSVAGIITINLAAMLVAALAVLAGSVLAFGSYILLSSLANPLMGAAAAGLFGLLAAGVFIASTSFSQAGTTAYQTGLYHYTQTGRLDGPYTKETLVDAWKPYEKPNQPGAPPQTPRNQPPPPPMAPTYRPPRRPR